jgi:hypothetical protein
VEEAGNALIEMVIAKRVWNVSLDGDSAVHLIVIEPNE